MSQKIIQQYNISAKKSLGQNFLIDEKKVSSIWDILDISGKNIVEVWPWYWALTEKLLVKKPQSLHLVELDSDMISILEERISIWELTIWDCDFKIFHEDVLDFKPSFREYSLIANIPYYITSPILQHFLYECENTPKAMVILMQKDVGDKILWGKKDKSSVLSLMVAKKCNVEEKLFVGKESFSPQPKVESSVLSFELHDKFENIDDEAFLKFIKMWFAQPRKKLVKNLENGWFQKEKIEDFLCLQWFDLNFRGEDGNIVFWIQLFQKLIIDS